MTRYTVEFDAPSHLGTAHVVTHATTDRGPEFALDLALAGQVDRTRYMARRMTTLDITSAVVRPQEDTPA
jgi:hypothetical protein